MTEDQRREYKSSWRDEWMKSICGFANAQGGILEVGKDDHGTILGLPDAPKLLVDLPNKIRDVLGIIPSVNLENEEGHEFIRIIVDPSPTPISYKGEYFFRSGATNQTLKGSSLDQFLLRKQGKTWDGVPVPGVSVKDLDEHILDDFKQRALQSQRLSEKDLKGSNAVLIERLRLTEGSYLKRSALLLFHPDPERFVTGSYVKIGYFSSQTDLLYQDEVHGDLFTQVDNTVDLLRTKYLKALISYEGLQRIETFPMPGDALREAVTNAILHKDYGSHIPIQIRVYDDRLSIWNNGQLPPEWNADRLLREHSSHPFNPEIAHVFFRAGMIESWGRGIERIVESCRKAHIPSPKFLHETTGLRVEFPYPPTHIHPEKTIQKTTQKTIQKTEEKTQGKILDLISANPSLSLQELADMIGMSRAGIVWQIKKLKKEKRIERVGPDKGGSWKVLK